MNENPNQTSRTPIHEVYDALLDIICTHDGQMHAHSAVKFTYMMGANTCTLTQAEPLLFDFRDATLVPRIPTGSDFLLPKKATDIVVQGKAYASQGRPIRQMNISLQLGDLRKSIAVFGQRSIEWKQGHYPVIGSPEPFINMPLTYQNAYGGIDWRVKFPDEQPGDILEPSLMSDHPGMYPRNPFGRGYLVEPDPVADMWMPNLEDPHDLLTPERLLVRDPRRWYLQPLPWNFDWVNAYTFPRYAYALGSLDAFYPGPEQENLPEVRRGFVEKNYRSIMQQFFKEHDTHTHPRFWQEASYGLTSTHIQPEIPVRITGLHPDFQDWQFRLSFQVPTLDFVIHGKTTRIKPQLNSIVFRPSERKVALTYSGITPLVKKYIPQIHQKIPISVRINGGAAIHYEAPLTPHQEMDSVKSRKE